MYEFNGFDHGHGVKGIQQLQAMIGTTKCSSFMLSKSIILISACGTITQKTHTILSSQN